jgi:glycosyltransferase involved in cell wall biosynthesis
MRCASAQQQQEGSRTLRIAYVTETWPPEINGVALTVERSVRYLRERGHTLTLVRPRQRGEGPRDDAEEWRSWGLPIPMYPDLRMGLAFAANLERRLAARTPQLVHVATQGPLGRAALLAAKALGLPVTSDFRTNFHRYSRYYGFGGCERLIAAYLRRFHNRADRTFVPARALRAALSAQGFERLEVLGRGVDALRFTPAARDAALRRSWGACSDETPVALYVGRLAPEKNVALALAAHAAMRSMQPELRMVLVGDGPLRARLQKQYPQAIFAGVQRGAALAAHYASADLFLFPSQSETFGNVTLEALASGLALVAYDEAAAAEHVRDGVNGVLARGDDAAAFIDAACRALAHAAPGAPLRQLARVAALAADWEVVLRRFEHRLADVALREPAARARHVALA